MTNSFPENLDADGHFWLPDDPEHKIAGALTFSREEGGALSLIGSFATEEEMFSGPARQTSRIYGRTEKRHYTLDGCLTRHQSISLSGGVGRQRFHVARVIENALYEADENIDVDGLAVDHAELLAWTKMNGIETSITYEEDSGLKDLTIRSHPVEDVVVELEGGRLKLQHSVTRRDHLIEGLRLRQGVQAKFELDQLASLDSALDLASDFQDLLTIATDRIAEYGKVRILHPDLVIKQPDGETRRDYARLYNRWLVKADRSDRRITDHDMFFTFDELGAATGVGQWMTMASKYRSQLGRVMNTRYSSDMLLQDVMLARMSSLESLHKTFTGKKRVNLNRRLSELITLAGKPFATLFGDEASSGPRMATWQCKAKKERDNVAHHLGRSLHANVSEFYYVSEAAY